MANHNPGPMALAVLKRLGWVLLPGATTGTTTAAAGAFLSRVREKTSVSKRTRMNDRMKKRSGHMVTE